VPCADTSSPRKSSSSSKVKVLDLKSCYSVKFFDLSSWVLLYFELCS